MAAPAISHCSTSISRLTALIRFVAAKTCTATCSADCCSPSSHSRASLHDVPVVP
jgi:hypothetical protein